MSKKLIVIISTLFVLSAGAAGIYTADHDHLGAVDSHSGGTNSDGCHKNHKTGDYHCHNPK